MALLQKLKFTCCSVSSPLFMEIDSDTSPYDTSSLKPGMEEPSGTDFSLEKRPEPNIERQSVERLVEFELPLATRLQDIVLGEVDTAVPQSNSLRNYLSVSVDVTPESRIAGFLLYLLFVSVKIWT